MDFFHRYIFGETTKRERVIFYSYIGVIGIAIWSTLIMGISGILD